MISLKRHVPKMIICHVIGLDIQVYNKDIERVEVTEMQKVIDDEVPLLNAAIDSINMNAEVVGPWLTDTVHSWTNGRRIQKYKRLSDGLHPSEDKCLLWAKKISKAIVKNY